MFQPTEASIAKGLENRELQRSMLYESLVASSDQSLMLEIDRSKLEIGPSDTRSSICIRIVDARFPEFSSPMMAVYSKPKQVPAPDGFVEAATGDPQLYRDLVSPMDRGDLDNHLNDVASARDVGGFVGAEFDADDRVFVATLDADGSYAKLPVQEVVKLSGFDEDARHQSMVLAVALPNNWLNVSYVQEMLVQVNLAALTGEPEAVLDMVNKYVREQHWTDAHYEEVERRMDAKPNQPAPTDAVTEQINLNPMNEQTVHTITIPDSVRNSYNQP